MSTVSIPRTTRHSGAKGKSPGPQIPLGYEFLWHGAKSIIVQKRTKKKYARHYGVMHWGNDSGPLHWMRADQILS